MSKTPIEKANSIVSLMEKINNHKDIKTALCYDNWSNKTFINCEENKVPSDLMKLISELRMVLDEELISSEGNHSDVYYALPQTSKVVTQVFESDSFGPLSVGVKFLEGKWWITYG